MTYHFISIYYHTLSGATITTGGRLMGHILKARTHRLIFTDSVEESAIESADFTAQSADSMADSMMVGRLALSNMFNILNPLESSDYWSRPTGNCSSGYGP